MGDYVLQQPILRRTVDQETREERVEELRPAGTLVPLRRAQARDVKLATRQAKEEIEVAIKLIARLSPLDEEEAELLDMIDFEELADRVSGKSPSGPPIGGTA